MLKKLARNISSKLKLSGKITKLLNVTKKNDKYLLPNSDKSGGNTVLMFVKWN